MSDHEGLVNAALEAVNDLHAARGEAEAARERLRLAVVAAVEAGVPKGPLAERLGIGRQTVFRMVAESE
ncbi:helix-turn-helix domain-containing protein [Actinomyces bowdenii]|uniref:helix-turn-helix domain-containing protein n=1 Tax=Actinomyces bowdenii TaxID=131109 RepID=UPI00214CDF35|nr:helix-turn-helix domain-containing protein [Actinomyces bowdenii]MCR2051434.1 helix-turn-helix domain-containing protein [Actinomyces bowdenii]